VADAIAKLVERTRQRYLNVWSGLMNERGFEEWNGLGVLFLRE